MADETTTTTTIIETLTTTQVPTIEAVTVDTLDLTFMKNYLKVDYKSDDQLIITLIDSAKSKVQTYLNRNFVDFIPEVPHDVVVAMISLIAHWYDYRGIRPTGSTSAEIPYTFKDILEPYRYYFPEDAPEDTTEDVLL
jgi:uncharacterized phage protein (predicted DNA packaging)